MLPRELPISQDALDVAEATMFVMKDKPRLEVVEAIVREFLQAEGFELQHISPDPGSATQFFPQSRLVSPWKPAPSSTEGGEG